MAEEAVGLRTRLWILLALALVMGGILFGIELPREKQSESDLEEDLKLFDFRPEEVDTLQYWRQGESVVLARQPEGWAILHPLREPALADAVEEQLAQLSRAEAVRVLADSISTEDWAFYGLASPERGRRDLRITLDDGSVQVLHVGNETPGGGFTYVRPGGTDRLLMAERNLHQLSWSRVSGFRRVGLFEIADSMITRLEVEGPRQSWSARRDAEGMWTDGQGRPLSRRRLRDITYDLANTGIRAFDRRPEGSEWRAWGLDPPYASIRWWSEEGRSGEVELGNDAEENSVFARRDRSPDLLRLAPLLLRHAETPVDSLLDLNPLRLNFARVDSITLVWAGGRHLRLRRRGHDWRVLGPTAKWRAEEETMNLAAKNFVVQLETVPSLQTWLVPEGEETEAVLDHIAARIWLYRRGGDRVVVLLGWKGRGERHWLAIPFRRELYQIDRGLYVSLRGVGLIAGLLDP